MVSRKRPPTASGKELSESQGPKLLDALKTRVNRCENSTDFLRTR